jgi:serine/threonine-protein kinase HipA
MLGRTGHGRLTAASMPAPCRAWRLPAMHNNKQSITFGGSCWKNSLYHSYELAFQVIKKLGLPMDATEELFRRMSFNIVARNQDDHVKNIALLMDKNGTWSLSPAFDMTYAYNPTSSWVGKHQMSLNGKRDGFTLKDFEACGKTISLKRGVAREILTQVQNAVSNWKSIAQEVKVPPVKIKQIAATHRTFMPS